MRQSDWNPWQKFAAELDRWAPGEATFWWRDDDAIAPTTALERLLALPPRNHWRLP